MNTLIKRNPDLFGGWLENFFNESMPLQNEMKPSFSMPAVNIKNNENDFEIEVAAPGLEKDDFNIEVKENVLTLSVDKTSETEEKEDNFTRKEFNYFNFKRSFALPKNGIDTENVLANYKDGLLKISLPKQIDQKENVKKISVQ